MTALDSRWFQFSEDDLAQQFQARLPQGHRLRLIQWRSGREFIRSRDTEQGYFCRWDHAEINYGLAQYCNLARRFLAQAQPSYDLVIRGRLDAAPDTAIDLARAAEQAREYPRALATSQRERQGVLGFCDHLIWGSEQAMNMVSDCIDWWPWARKQGIEANTELVTQFVLKTQGLEWPSTDWNSTLKTRGSIDDQGVFHPELGTWQLARDHL